MRFSWCWTMMPFSSHQSKGYDVGWISSSPYSGSGQPAMEEGTCLSAHTKDYGADELVTTYLFFFIYILSCKIAVYSNKACHSISSPLVNKLGDVVKVVFWQREWRKGWNMGLKKSWDKLAPKFKRQAIKFWNLLARKTHSTIWCRLILQHVFPAQKTFLRKLNSLIYMDFL